MEGVKSWKRSADEPPGVRDVERAEVVTGTGEAVPGPGLRPRSSRRV